MKAIVMTEAGDPGVLIPRDLPEPEITAPSQIKVRLEAAGINPVDTKIRRGGLLVEGGYPAVLGCDGAGAVVETGADAGRFRVGDRVWFCHGGLGGEQGNYAEYNVIDERWAAAMPSNFSFVEAAAAPLVLITAWGALFDRGGLRPGQTVLIHAGAGGVGHVAVQLAKWGGARVIATVGSDQKADFAKKLGADEVVVYTRESVVDAVDRLTGGKGVDLAFDTVGPAVFRQSIPATAHFGRLITLLDFGQADLREARLRNLLIGFELMLTPMLRNLPEARDRHVEILKDCAQLAEKDRLKIHVGKILPLAEAAEAHRIIEEGHATGKMVLKI